MNIRRIDLLEKQLKQTKFEGYKITWGYNQKVKTGYFLESFGLIGKNFNDAYINLAFLVNSQRFIKEK